MRIGAIGAALVGIEVVVGRPVRIWNLTNRIDAFAQESPVLAQVAGAGEHAGHADYGNRLGAFPVSGFDVRGLARCVVPFQGGSTPIQIMRSKLEGKAVLRLAGGIRTGGRAENDIDAYWRNSSISAD